MDRPLMPLLAVQAAVEYSRLDPKPPVTSALILANTLIYLRPGPLHRLLPPIRDVYFNPHLILKNRDFKRFFLSAFYHSGGSHLFYNMLGLLWDGIELETLMGSIEFASMVATLLGMSRGITLLMAKMLLFFNIDRPYYWVRSAGFSGVLFAMKVVLSSQSDDCTYQHGLFIVPSWYAAWVELIIIQLLVPNASFLGHLGGILGGLLYLKLNQFFGGSDPLASLVRGFIDIVKWPLRLIQSLFSGCGSRVFGRGSVGGSSRSRRVTTSGIWRCRPAPMTMINGRTCMNCVIPRGMHAIKGRMLGSHFGRTTAEKAGEVWQVMEDSYFDVQFWGQVPLSDDEWLYS